MDATERAYHLAAGCCLSAMQELRRHNGKTAIAELRDAIRIIEAEQRRAQRDYRPPALEPPF